MDKTKIMSEKIRVAIICTSLNQMGGKNVHFRNMYLRLKEQGIGVIIILSSSIEKEHAGFLAAAGVHAGDVVFISRFKKWFILPYLLALRDVLVSRRINIVHTFQVQSDIFGSLAALLAGVKTVISQQESKFFEEDIPVFKLIFYRVVNRCIKHFISRTVVVSQALKEELIVQDLRPAERITVIPLGVDIPQQYRSREFRFSGLREGAPLIGAITRLNKEKGIDRFIQAMPYILRRIPQAHFLIVGMGEERDSLKAIAQGLNLSSAVEFLPWVNPVYDILEKIDVFVMPSMREGCPTALLEALAFSRPVVASDISGINELIEDGLTGVAVDTSRPELFAERIISLCEDPEAAVKMGEEGRKAVLSRFTLDCEIERFRKLYHELLESPRC